MADENKIEVQIVLDDGSIQKGFVKMEQQAKETSSNLGAIFTGASGKIAAALATVVAGFSLKEAISEAIGAEKAITQFNLSLANAGNFSQEASKKFQDFANSLQTTVGIDNDLIVQNAALLASLGKLSGDGLERATKAAIDLSKGLGISLDSAFELIAKGAAGNTTALSRYGIKLDEGVPKAERFAAALAQIEQKFGGVAQGLADTTFEGALNKLDVSFKNLLETVGRFFVESPVVRETLKFISDAFVNLSKTIDGFSGQDIVGNIIKSLASLVQFISTYLAPPIEIFIRGFLTGLQAIKFAIDALAFGLSGVAKLIVESIVLPIRDFTIGAAKLVSLFNSELGSKLEASAKSIATNVTKPFQDEFQKTKDIAAESFQSLSQSAETGLNTNISASVNNFIANYQSKIESAKLASDGFKNKVIEDSQTIQMEMLTLGGAFSSVFQGMQMEISDLAKNATANFQAVGRAAIQGMGNGIGQGFAAVGKALYNGENALEAFTKAFINAIGQQAIASGTRFILEGIAYLFVPGFQGVGAAMISAGAALATFGGVLSAASAGGGGKAAPIGGAAGDGGGGLFSQPTNPSSDLANNDEERRPGTNIEVNIAGNVLDSKESSLQIVQLLNDAFDQQGVTVTG